MQSVALFSQKACLKFQPSRYPGNLRGRRGHPSDAQHQTRCAPRARGRLARSLVSSASSRPSRSDGAQGVGPVTARWNIYRFGGGDGWNVSRHQYESQATGYMRGAGPVLGSFVTSTPSNATASSTQAFTRTRVLPTPTTPSKPT